jgi:DNA modification methylase
MSILKLPLAAIQVAPNRQRKEIEGEALSALMESIGSAGLLQPIVVREAGGVYTLVAGERRLRAISNFAGLAQPYRFGGADWSPEFVPCISIGDLDPLAAEEAELEENIRRVDLTWEERAAATARLADLRRRKAASLGAQGPSVADIASEVRGASEGTAHEATRRELVLAPFLAAGAEHLKGAKSLDEAWKAHLRQEEVLRNQALSLQVGATYGKHSHTLHQADCLQWLAACQPASFDVILTDPPYGMGADNFGDAGGRLTGQTHVYSDTPEDWQRLVSGLAAEWFRVAKDQAHLYICCDIDGFHFAREALEAAGWWVHRTPIINFKKDGSRVPWPQHGPQRKWELVLYANKGKKPVTRIYPDIIETKGDDNLGHGAQKPVDLYVNLLTRSVRPGDSVLDCFGGTGTILVAAHQMQCRATYVEQDPNYFAIAVKRLEALE